MTEDEEDEKIRELLSDDIEEAQLPPDRLKAIEERAKREFEMPDFKPERPSTTPRAKLKSKRP